MPKFFDISVWYRDLQWLWGVVVLAWIWLLLTHQPIAHSAYTFFGFIHALASWETMLAAMMLPSVIPVARAFGIIVEEERRRSHQFVFLAAYLTIWTLFALLMVTLQGLGLSNRMGLSSPMGQALSLIGVGIFQWTPLKLACLRGCRSAIAVVSQHYKPGFWGAWGLGWQHGLSCLGCCWALMAEMTVLGLHSFAVMALFTAIMLIERFWQHGEKFAIVVGIAFMMGGALSWIMPSLMS